MVEVRNDILNGAAGTRVIRFLHGRPSFFPRRPRYPPSSAARRRCVYQSSAARPLCPCALVGVFSYCVCPEVDRVLFSRVCEQTEFTVSRILISVIQTIPPPSQRTHGSRRSCSPCLVCPCCRQPLHATLTVSGNIRGGSFVIASPYIGVPDKTLDFPKNRREIVMSP